LVIGQLIRLINNSFKNKSKNQFEYVTWFSNFKNQITAYEFNHWFFAGPFIKTTSSFRFSKQTQSNEMVPTMIKEILKNWDRGFSDSEIFLKPKEMIVNKTK
jgi:hypothetical protein